MCFSGAKQLTKCLTKVPAPRVSPVPSASVHVGKEGCPMAVLPAASQMNSVRSRWEGKVGDGEKRHLLRSCALDSQWSQGQGEDSLVSG